jgi:hypothetical protein
VFDHFWDFNRLVEDKAPKQKWRLRDLSPFAGFLGFRVYVMDMECRPMGLPMLRPLL